MRRHEAHWRWHMRELMQDPGHGQLREHMQHWHALHGRGWRRHHRALHQRFRHSLGARLTLVFLFLAGAGGALVHLGAQHGLNQAWMVAGLLLLTFMAYASIRRMLRPLRSLAHGAAMFGRGELSHRIRVRHHDEIGALAGRFNRMADDIQAMLDAKRELLLAISHELRSPLTRARLNAELIDEAAPQQAVVKELGVMRDLIEDLLERERLDAGHRALLLEPCDLATLVDGLMQNRFADARSSGLLAVEVAGALPPLRLDRARMQVLLGNLLDNALRHHDAERGAVVLAVEQLPKEGGDPALAGHVRISVRDRGPGVPPDALDKLGQPFFRPDAARTRGSGGAGLGLNLCRLIAVAHGGTLTLRNADPGLLATVDLPVNGPGR